MRSNLLTSLKWQICWGSVTGCRENLHAERYRLRCHFYKRIQRGTFVAVSFENQSDRLLSYLVTVSEEYEEEEEEEYEENENGRCHSLVFGMSSLAFKVSLQRACSIFNITLPCFGNFQRILGLLSYTNV